MADPKIISNLGVEVSTRYAQDRQLYDETFIKDSGEIPLHTIKDVTSPAYPSEFELLFETQKRNLPWPEFPMPTNFNEQKGRVFTHQILPSLGSDEKLEAQTQRINASVRPPSMAKDRMSWEDQKDADDAEKEKKVLLGLVQSIKTLDKYLIDINSRRNQYQKG